MVVVKDEYREPYFKNPELEALRLQKIDYYLENNKHLREKSLLKQVNEMVVLEIEWDKFTKIINHYLMVENDIENAKEFLMHRKKCDDALIRRRTALGLNINSLVKKDKENVSVDEDFEKAMVLHQQFQESHS